MRRCVPLTANDIAIGCLFSGIQN